MARYNNIKNMKRMAFLLSFYLNYKSIIILSEDKYIEMLIGFFKGEKGIQRDN